VIRAVARAAGPSGRASPLVKPAVVRAIGMAFEEYQSGLSKTLARAGIDAYLVGDRRGAVRLGADYEELNYAAAEAFAQRYRDDMETRGGTTIRGEFVPWIRDGAEATRSAVVDAIEEGVRSGKGSRAIARDLRGVIDEEAHDPALVAQTEMSRLVHVGEHQRYVDEGVSFVDWLLGDKTCPECMDIAMADVGYGPGRYPIDECPEIPVHPKCECDTKAVQRGQESTLRAHVFEPGHEAYNPDMSRDEEGKWSGGGGASTPVSRVGKAWVLADGTPAPGHVQALGIPPAWTDVVVDPNPDADLVAKGHDSKGRTQYIYSERYDSEQQAAKFARVSEMADRFDEIRAQNEANRGTEEADLTALVMSTGIRPGSEKDTRGDVRAYGATTLEGRHVVVTEEGVRLQFVGKKGVDLDIPVEDKSVADMLVERAGAAGADGQLFPTVGPSELSDYVHGLNGGGFKTKDFRTALGTSTARDLVARTEAPTSKTAYKRAVRGVAKAVAARLGNTPTVALQRYIAPEVFTPWREAAHV